MAAGQRALEALFKAKDDHFTFRAPNPWVFGGAAHYSVTEAEKEQILRTLYIPQWLVIGFWLLFFALFFGGGSVLLYFLSGDSEPSTADILIMIALAILGLLLPLPLIGHLQLYRLKPILQTLRPTDERISFREISAATRKITPARDYVRNCMLAGFVFGITMLNVGMQLHIAITKGGYGILILMSIAASLWAFVMVYSGLQAMRRSSEASAS